MSLLEAVLRPKAMLAVAGVAFTLMGASLLRERPLSEAGPFGPPIQIPVEDTIELPAPDRYRITATDEYFVEALIVGRASYGWDRESDLAPVDFALAWGPLTSERNLRGIEYTQRNRWYYYQWQTADVTVSSDDIRANSANTHILLPPNNPELERTVLGLRRGDAVRLKGFLVSVEAEDGWNWRSSRDRNDSGEGSCELLYVIDVEVVG
ncbi:MAG: hypothetical protein SF028_01095 [Candidatus Sumerlaeia bacterium]|nr:hypothetical protein [Candidatus Sumerlaeia bacterium]